GYDAGFTDIAANGYDDEKDYPGCLEWVRECFLAERMAYNLSHSSMDQYPNGLPLSSIDLFHLDTQYSKDNLQRDMLLAVKTLSPKGILVVSAVYPNMPTPSAMKSPQGE